MNSPSREVAQREPMMDKGQVALNTELLNLAQAERICDVLSRSALVPKSLQGNPASVFHVVMTGQRMGLHWTDAVRVIYSPGDGQIGLRGQFLLHRLRQAGHRYKFRDEPDACTFTLTRGDTPEGGEPEVFEIRFTVEDAIQAGLAKRNAEGALVALSRDNKPLPWQLWHRRLLRWRAVAECVGIGAPECSLGFEIEGDLMNELPQPVELHPQAPAPPEPDAGQAATGEDQAAQAEQLREMDQRMRADPALNAYQEASNALADPVVGGIPESEPAADSDVGGTSEAEPPAGDPLPMEAQDFAPPTGEAQGPDTTPPMDRELASDAAARAKEKTLSEWFTTMGYDPKRYRPQVLHACSVHVRRRITGIRDMRAAEVMGLSNELSALHRRTDELAPVSRLADQMSTWEQEWREADPKGYAEYEEGK